jgi:Holliday junction resolvasome RuvABC endonuclease subunit
MQAFSEAALKQELLEDALAAKLPQGQAEELADLATKEVKKWLKGRAKVTKNDIQRVVYRILTKYNENLAFIYASHGKII